MSNVSFRRRLEAGLALLGVGIAIWVVLTTANIARTGWVAIPTVDEWDRWTTFLTLHYSAAWFFIEHWNHRIAAPKLLFVIDHVLFGARGWFLLICSFCFQALTALMVWRLAPCGVAYASRTERWMQAAVVACCLFSAQQWINFVMPFQVAFTLVYCAAAAALFALWRSLDRESSRTWAWACILFATVATYTMANGVLIWPVLLFAAGWLGAPRRWTVTLAMAALVVSGTFFYRWHVISGAVRVPLGQRLPQTLTFGLTLLGAPLAPPASRYDHLRSYAAIAGAVVVLAMAVHLILL